MSRVGLVPIPWKNQETPRMKVRAFTLVELLVTTTIIGLLAVAGTASYSFVRAKARDAKRVADISTIRDAVEIYFEQHGSYPISGPEGLVLGTDEAAMITDAGITSRSHARGAVYLQGVPYNILPGGMPYVYRSKNKNGSLCIASCPSYEVTFALEAPTGSLAAGPHLLTDAGYMGSEGGASGVSRYQAVLAYVPTPEQLASAFGTAKELSVLARQFADRGDVQAANAGIIAPVSVASSILSLLAGLSGVLPLANAGQALLLVFAQPFLFLSRRRRQGWGVVYNANTKVPLDLVSVRLIDTARNRVVATKVTDKDGRFSFAPKAGTYRLEVLKPGFVFPAVSLEGASVDGAYADLYYGTLIEAGADGVTLALNVPMDVAGEPPDAVRALLSERNRRSIRGTFAALGPVLAAISFAASPGLPMLLLFLVQLFFLLLFRRVAEPPAPKSQGTVYDIDTRRPVAHAVVRVLSLPYHKVLETKLTDAGGRYGFNVGAGLYELTVVKPGYEKTVTDPIDFTKIDKPAWIASDLPMQKLPPGKS